MKQEQTIISIVRVSAPYHVDVHEIHSFPSRATAKEYIEARLESDRKAINKDSNIPEPGLTIIRTEGNVRDMWNAKSGTFRAEIGAHRYHFAFLNVPAEYQVSDDELVSALDAFSNSTRSHEDYKTVAERISRDMHRYVQNQLWKFLKQLIRAFAAGGHDQRNQTAWNQAGLIHEFMETNNI